MMAESKMRNSGSVFIFSKKMLKYPGNERKNTMRKFVVVFLVLIFMLGGISMTAYASDCTKDTLVDKFGDWFGNLGKPEKSKNRNIAVRRANRLVECTEEQERRAAKSV